MNHFLKWSVTQGLALLVCAGCQGSGEAVDHGRGGSPSAGSGGVALSGAPSSGDPSSGAQPNGSDDSMVRPLDQVWQTPDGTYSTPFPPSLEIMCAEQHPQTAHFTASGSNAAGDGLSVEALWALKDFARDMVASLNAPPLVSPPMVHGTANVMMGTGPNSEVDAADGMFTVHFADGRATGGISTSNQAIAAAHLDARVGITCWAPRAPLQPGEQGTNAPGESLVADTEFTTPCCAPFKDWRAP